MERRIVAKTGSRYIGALLIIIATEALRLLSIKVLGMSVQHVTVYPAIILTALTCGLYPGLLATILLSLTTFYWMLQPAGSLASAGTADFISLLFMIFNSAMICFITELMFRARKNAELLRSESMLEQERRRTTEAMLGQQVLLERMSRLAKVGGWGFDIDTMSGEWTEEAALIHGVELTSAVTVQNGIEFFQGESRREIERAIKEAIEFGKPYELDLELMTPSGEHKWVRTQGQPVKRDGVVVRIEGAIQDITEQKLAAIALQESETRYAAIFENMQEGLALCRFHFDGEGKPAKFEYINVNSSFYRHTGLKYIIKQKIYDVGDMARFVSPDLVEVFARVAACGQPEKIDTYVPILDKWFSVSACSPGKGYFIAIFDVITDKKNAELAREATIGILSICNRADDLQALSTELTEKFRQLTGSSSAAIHLKPSRNLAGVNYCAFDDGWQLCNPEQKNDISWADGFVGVSPGQLTTDSDGHGGEAGASAMIPLVHHGEILGVLRLDYLNRHNLPGSLIEELTSLASYVAITIAKLRTEESLQELSTFYRQIIDNIGEGIIVHNREMHYILWNKFMEEISGIRFRAIAGRHPAEVFPFLYELGVIERIEHTLRGDSPPPVDLPFYFEKSGRSGWFLDSCVQMLDTDGNLTGAINILHDISERRAAEESLERAMAFIDNALNNLRDIFFIISSEGRLIRWNRTLSLATGYSDEELARLNHLDLTTPELRQHQEDEFNKALEQGNASMEGILLTRDGRRVPYEYTASVLKNSDGKIIGVCGTGRDISERKTMEKQLLHSQKMEGIGTIAGGIAHDFNNLLTVISGYGCLIQMKTDESSPLRGDIEQILAASEKAAYLVNRLLTFSRKVEFNLTESRMSDIIVTMEKFLARVIGEDILLITDIAEDDLLVKVDRNQIEQVLMNLVSNASDAMPGGGELRIRLTRAVLDDLFIRQHGYGTAGGYALVSVCDTGTGIDPETLQHIFEPYYTTKEMGKGTGLGLSIVYGIIKKHGGYIDVTSSPGRGTCFQVYIPLLESACISDQQPSAIAESGQGTILLAEDDQAVRNILHAMLTSLGYRVIETTNGSEAVKTFAERSSEIDLLLLDIIMPGMTGADAYRAMCRTSPSIKTIFISGYPAETIASKTDLPENAEVVSKPVQRHELALKIRKLMSGNDIQPDKLPA